jgi:phenylacetate-CoA ligase
VDLYGLSEVIGPGVAAECVESKDGPAIWEDHFYPEIIDPATGRVRADGEPGELVLTSLTKEALPIVRYRTRDLTTLLSPTSRSMRRLAKITGRSDDMLIIRGVNVFPSQIEELILRQQALTPHYLLEIRREGTLDELTVQVEVPPGSGATDGACRRAATDLSHAVKVFVGVTAAVVLREPGTLERSMGKAKRVLDKRQAQ